MKQLVKVTEVEGEGLTALLEKNVMLFCMNYIYAGKLVGVNDTYVKLEGAKLVYETGELVGKTWKDAQPFEYPLYINISAVESFAESGRK